MHKENSFIFITNVQHGACLLFDRKGLSCYRPKRLKSDRLAKNLFYMFWMLQKHIRIQSVFSGQLRHY